jgi:hypothetical protein
MTGKGIDRLVCNDLLGSMPWSVPGGLRRIEVLWVFEYFERKNENKREECMPWLLCNSYPTPFISSPEVYYSYSNG